MKKKHTLVLSSFSAKMPNSKYVTQKKRLLFELKNFRDHFNYDKSVNFLFEQEY